MNINYFSVDDFIGWNKTEAFVQALILKHNFKSVLEIGAGANPTISDDFINYHQISYTISDVDDAELNKASPIYRKLIIDLSKPLTKLNMKFDLVFSRMVGEHIPDAKIFHQNVFNILNDGGFSFHCFSTLYALPFLVNKLLPDKLSDLVLARLAPRDKHQHGKFKAHYDWCRGPSKIMISRFKNIGYEIIEYVGYFGHNYYKKFPFLHKLEQMKSGALKKLPLSYLTSYTHLILKKS